MSMIAYLRPVEEGQLPSLSSLDDEQMADFLFPEDDAPDDLDLDKSWHAIHFLLCGSSDFVDGPLGAAVLGGTPMGPDIGYGPARLLSSSQVKLVAAELPEPEELLARYDAAALSAAEVYPEIWDEEDDITNEYIGSNYEAMRETYRDAARDSKAMLLWLA